MKEVVKLTDYTFIDTDIQIHAICPDPPVRDAIEDELKKSRPIAMSEFSLVELKGNYIQNLILLRRKVSNSDSFELAYSRIQNTGGRRASLMLSQLIKWLGGVTFPINPWSKAQNILLAYLDAQILASWKKFQTVPDKIFRDFRCTRAKENPEHIRENWYATIHKCNLSNTKCKINEFLLHFKSELQTLVKYLKNIDDHENTNELIKILNIASDILQDEEYTFTGHKCRQIGDLLIGLQSKSGIELLSSNYKEHGHLHKPLAYNYRQFPIAAIRSK